MKNELKPLVPENSNGKTKKCCWGRAAGENLMPERKCDTLYLNASPGKTFPVAAKINFINARNWRRHQSKMKGEEGHEGRGGTREGNGTQFHLLDSHFIQRAEHKIQQLISYSNCFFSLASWVRNSSRTALLSPNLSMGTSSSHCLAISARVTASSRVLGVAP